MNKPIFTETMIHHWVDEDMTFANKKPNKIKFSLNQTQRLSNYSTLSSNSLSMRRLSTRDSISFEPLDELKNYGTFKDFITETNKNIISSNKPENKNLIGKGAYGDVYLITDSKNNKYALKVVNKQKLINSNYPFQQMIKEISIHSRIDHPFIISLKEFTETNEDFMLLMDYCKNGTLYSKIKKIRGFSEETSFKYFIQTCSALYFLQRNKIIHRDLKPENLLLDEFNNVKLIDFGWSEYTHLLLKDTCGTVEYMAPEIILKLPYDEKVDNWALGILLYELNHGYTPFYCDSTEKEKSICNKILKGEVSYKEGLSEDIKDLISKLLNKNKDKRITLEEVFEHSWVIGRKINFRTENNSSNSLYLKPNKLNFSKTLTKSSQIDSNEEDIKESKVTRRQLIDNFSIISSFNNHHLNIPAYPKKDPNNKKSIENKLFTEVKQKKEINHKHLINSAKNLFGLELDEEDFDIKRKFIQVKSKIIVKNLNAQFAKC